MHDCKFFFPKLFYYSSLVEWVMYEVLRLMRRICSVFLTQIPCAVRFQFIIASTLSSYVFSKMNCTLFFNLRVMKVFRYDVWIWKLHRIYSYRSVKLQEPNNNDFLNSNENQLGEDLYRKVVVITTGQNTVWVIQIMLSPLTLTDWRCVGTN